MTRVAFGKVADKLRAKLGYAFPRLGPVVFFLFFKLMPRRLECEIFPGIRLLLDFSDGIMRATYWKGRRFERPSPERLAAWIKSNGVFFDIGANYGFYSYWMLSQHPDIRVYAFEPNPTTYQHLVRAKEMNRLDRLLPVPLGLSDEAGSHELHVSPEDSSYSTFGDHPLLPKCESTAAACLPFDRWLEKEGLTLPGSPCWVVKIDVEGYELRALKGMEKCLVARAFAGLVVEINPFTLEFCGTTPLEILRFMTDHGYVLAPDSPCGRAGNTLGTGNAWFVPAA